MATLTTNVSKCPQQQTTIIDLIDTVGGGAVPAMLQGRSAEEVISSWVNYCNTVPADERNSTKQVFGLKRRCILTFNNTSGNIKLQFKQNVRKVYAQA